MSKFIYSLMLSCSIWATNVGALGYEVTTLDPEIYTIKATNNHGEVVGYYFGSDEEGPEGIFQLSLDGKLIHRPFPEDFTALSYSPLFINDLGFIACTTSYGGAVVFDREDVKPLFHWIPGTLSQSMNDYCQIAGSGSWLARPYLSSWTGFICDTESCRELCFDDSFSEACIKLGITVTQLGISSINNQGWITGLISYLETLTEDIWMHRVDSVEDVAYLFDGKDLHILSEPSPIPLSIVCPPLLTNDGKIYYSRESEAGEIETYVWSFKSGREKIGDFWISDANERGELLVYNLYNPEDGLYLYKEGEMIDLLPYIGCEVSSFDGEPFKDLHINNMGQIIGNGEVPFILNPLGYECEESVN